MRGKTLEGKVALVTGASKGIGRAIARRFTEEGADVAINYRTDREGAESLLRETGRGRAFKADVGSSDDVKRMVEDIHDSMGKVDILVNNAGIMNLMAVEDLKIGDYESMHRVNVMGPLHTVSALLGDLKKSSSGRVINVASNAGIGTAAPGTTFYAMTKASVIMFTKRLAYDLSGTGVRVNAIAPGWIETDLTVGGKDEDLVSGMKDYFRSRTTLGMYGNPDHISGIASFLASEDSDYINGQVIVADGGRFDNLTHSL